MNQHWPSFGPRFSRWILTATAAALLLVAAGVIAIDFVSPANWLSAGIFLGLAIAAFYCGRMIDPKPGTIKACNATRQFNKPAYTLTVYRGDGLTEEVPVNEWTFSQYHEGMVYNGLTSSDGQHERIDD